MLWFFFKNKWFNVICILKDINDINYYINIASPYYIEEKAIKYIDFDLDIKITHDNQFKVVDIDEYERNLKHWNYPKKVLEKVEEAKNEIIQLIKNDWFANLFKPEELKYLKKYIASLLSEDCQLKICE